VRLVHDFILQYLLAKLDSGEFLARLLRSI